MSAVCFSANKTESWYHMVLLLLRCGVVHAPLSPSLRRRRHLLHLLLLPPPPPPPAAAASLPAPENKILRDVTHVANPITFLCPPHHAASCFIRSSACCRSYLLQARRPSRRHAAAAAEAAGARPAAHHLSAAVRGSLRRVSVAAHLDSHSLFVTLCPASSSTAASGVA
jgi:hypothetical protein